MSGYDGLNFVFVYVLLYLWVVWGMVRKGVVLAEVSYKIEDVGLLAREISGGKQFLFMEFWIIYCFQDTLWLLV